MTVVNAESLSVRIASVRESVDKGTWIIECDPVAYKGRFQILTKSDWKASLCHRYLDHAVMVTWYEDVDDWGIRSGFKNLVRVQPDQPNEAA